MFVLVVIDILKRSWQSSNELQTLGIIWIKYKILSKYEHSTHFIQMVPKNGYALIGILIFRVETHDAESNKCYQLFY